MTCMSRTKTIPTLLNRTNNFESFINFIASDWSLINNTVICDDIVRNDHLASLPMLGLRVENKMMPFQKKFYDETNNNITKIKHCLEQQNWPKTYVQSNLDSMLQVLTQKFYGSSVIKCST